MNLQDFKQPTETLGPPVELDVDEEGRLYSRHVRTMLESHGVPADARTAVEACAALGHASRLMHLAMERWADKQGLSEMRLSVLFTLRHAGVDGMPLGTLATRLHVSPRNVTGLVDHLERDGLVVRVPDPSDRRSVLARLTDEGRARIEACGAEAVDRQRALLAGFGDEDLAQLRHLCLGIVKNMETILAKKQPSL